MAGFFNFEQEPRSLVSEEQGCLPALSYKERVTGFVVCFGLGILVDLLSWGSLVGLLTGDPTRFALSYSLGNALSIAGTGFLIGFERQWKSVFDKKRRISSVVFLGALVMTLVSALVFKIAILTLCFILVQICAFVWYVASYFPWGREIIAGCGKKCFGKCLDV